MSAIKSQKTKLSSYMEIVEVLDRSDFIALEEEWNALVRAACDEPFYRHEFIRIWIDNFAPNAKLKILTGRNKDGKLVAALPLMEERSSICGLPVRQLVSTANTHSCRFDMIAEDGESAGQQFFDHLARDNSWDALKITDVPDGGKAWQIYRAAEEAGFPVGNWESQRSPYLSFPSSYDELLEGKSSQFNANLRRRRRKLEKMGTVCIERVTGGEKLCNYLEEGFAIEQSGWKGEKGTAIAQDKCTHGFYTELARSAANHNYLSLFFLKLNSKAIAFHYGFTYCGIYYMPKLGFDESLKDCSPGLLLLEEIIKDCISGGLKGYDFLGSDVDWKMKWSETLRPHNWLFIFRNSSFGRVLHKAKFKVIPAAKQVLERWRG